ncbi:site-specific integrase [Gracilimonas mengyeensis]|uniref:Site-specific recombinase XerD n=1 Tax=Gracilimonas mengyeensis TaxID=1302730 RepID=A0A521EI74_9BACT|nr:site-specific integrase [Gracilimonas mengyeensis]SMO83634.1 Site-specific recombinase XerD [Gracilimonas mengyeensis]
MKVHLRQRKQTKSGKISLYLEYYKGTVKTEDGKTKAVRDYEYLDLYLKDNPQTKQERQTNKETLELAKSIKAKRELEIKNGQYGFKRSGSSNADFMAFFRKQRDNRESNENTYNNWDSTYKHLESFVGSDSLPFKRLDQKFCEEFLEYLKNVKKTDGNPLASASVGSYFSKFRAGLKKAVKKRYLSHNPASDVEAPSIKTPKREHLTVDELKAVAKEECRYPVLKNAFLFACLTGLRWSDIQKLTWSEIEQNEDGWRVVFHQKKTDGLQYVEIPDNAKQYLTDPKAPEVRVFKGLKYSSYMNVALQRWMMEAGITKNITFHCARHTYAILQLQHGADIYTVSKLLGHKNIKTTQIYADIVDQKRKEAVNRLNSIDL